MFEPEKAVIVKVTLFWNVTSCTRAFICEIKTKRPLVTEYGNLRKPTAWLKTFLQNVCTGSELHRASYSVCSGVVFRK
jgi:hypothetical protein